MAYFLRLDPAAGQRDHHMLVVVSTPTKDSNGKGFCGESFVIVVPQG